MLSVLTSHNAACNEDNDEHRHHNGHKMMCFESSQCPTTSDYSSNSPGLNSAACSDHSPSTTATTTNQNQPATTDDEPDPESDRDLLVNSKSAAIQSPATDLSKVNAINNENSISDTHCENLLAQEEGEQSLTCPFCNVLLLDPRYLQRHLQEAHAVSFNQSASEPLVATNALDPDDNNNRHLNTLMTGNGFGEALLNNTDYGTMMENFLKSAAMLDKANYDHHRNIQNDVNQDPSNDDSTPDLERKSNDTFECKPCAVLFSSELELWAHRRAAHCLNSTLLTSAKASSGQGRQDLVIAQQQQRSLLDVNKSKIFNPEAYCELCDKEFCNKYFLKTHKANKHGVYCMDDQQGPTSMVIQSKMGAILPTNSNNIESQVQLAHNRLSSLLNAPGMTTPPLMAAGEATAAGQHNGNISDQLNSSTTGRSSAGGTNEQSILDDPTSFLNSLPANFGSNFGFQSLESTACPFCHQIFPNAFLLQSHIFTFHGMGHMSSPSINPAALYALMNASSSTSVNPFLAQQLKMLNPHHLAMFSGLPSSAQTFGQSDLSLLNLDIPGLADFKSKMTNEMNDRTFNALSEPTVGAQSATSGGASSLPQKTDHSSHVSVTHSSGIKTMATPLSVKAAGGGVIGGVSGSGSGSGEAFCDLCRKVFCNKYFLKTHKLNKHGISPSSSSITSNNQMNNESGLSFAASSASREHRSPTASVISANRKRAYNKTGQHQLDYGIKLKDHQEGVDGVPLEESELPNSKMDNDISALNLATFSTEFPEAKRRRLALDFCSGSSDFEAINFSTASGSKINPESGRPKSDGSVKGPSSSGGNLSVDPDAYCNICCKEFCSKYFLKTHNLNIHGLTGPRTSPGSVGNISTSQQQATNYSMKSNDQSQGIDNQQQKFGTRSQFSTPPPIGSIVRSSGSVSGGYNKTPTSTGSHRYYGSTGKNFCEICNKEVCNKYYIRTHMLKMHGMVIDENRTIIGNINGLDGQIRYFKCECDTCGKAFPSKQQLKVHVQVVHCSGTAARDTHSNPPNSDFQNPRSHFSDQDADELNQLKIKMEFPDESPISKPQNLSHSEPPRNHPFNRRFKNVRWLKRERIASAEIASSSSMTTYQRQLSPASSGHRPIDVEFNSPPISDVACEYCGVRCDDQVELQMHVIDVHQREVRGLAERTALDAICSFKSKSSIDQSQDQQSDQNNASNCNTSNNSGGLNLSRKFSRIDETIDRIAAAKESPIKNAVVNHRSPEVVRSPSFGETTTTTKSAASDIAASHLPMVARNHIGTKMYKCSYCDYYTRWISNLSTHEKRHNASAAQTLDRNDRPFVCRVCLRAYRYAHSLQRHMEVHRLSSLGMQIQMMAHSMTNFSMPIATSVTTNGTFSVVNATSQNSSLISTVDQEHAKSDKNSAISSSIKRIKTTNTNNSKNAVAKTSPEKPSYVCPFCDKQFRNRELYRMHIFIIHKTSPSKSLMNNCSPETKKRKPKRVAAYLCKICGFSTKIYSALYQHVIDKHDMTPKGMSRERYEQPKETNDRPIDINEQQQSSPLNLKTNAPRRNDVDSDVDSHTFFAAMSNMAKNWPPLPKTGSVSPVSDSGDSNAAARRSNSKTFNHKNPDFDNRRFVMQPFFIKETSETSAFVPSVVYLPVLRHVDAPFDAKFSLFPITPEELSPNAFQANELFFSFFKSLVGKEVVVELKNDLCIAGTLHSVDQYLNVKMNDISVIEPEKYPHMLSVKNCFIRGSVIRYVQLPSEEVDTQLLQDATRKEIMSQNKQR